MGKYLFLVIVFSRRLALTLEFILLAFCLAFKNCSWIVFRREAIRELRVSHAAEKRGVRCSCDLTVCIEFYPYRCSFKVL